MYIYRERDCWILTTLSQHSITDAEMIHTTLARRYRIVRCHFGSSVELDLPSIHVLETSFVKP